MPKSLLRAPARLLVVAVAVGAPVVTVAPAHAAVGAAPTSPMNVVASLSGDDATVIWDSADPADPDDTGDEVVEYRVSLDGGTPQSAGSSNSKDFADLAAGPHTFTVVAVDRDGDVSSTSAPSNEVTVYDAPDAATGLNAEQTAAGELEVEWDYPEDDHGFDISGFDIDLVGVDEQVLDGEVDEFDTKGSFTDVPAGTYTLRVRTLSDGQTATAQLAGVVVKQAPAKVSAFSVKQTAPGEVTVSWKRPASGDVTGYGVGYGTGQMGNGVTVGPSKTSQTFTGLRPGRYSFGVRALDGAIMGDSSMTFLDVSNYDKKSSPTVKAADTTLKKGQKLVVTGTSKPGSFMTLEFKKAGSSEWVFLDDAKASTKKGKKAGTFTLSSKVPGSGTYRVVDNTTGRSSLTKAVTVAKKGR